MRGQTTLARSIATAGVGLHSGTPARLVVEPAEADSGIRLWRRGWERPLPARVDYAQELEWATRLGLGDGPVSTVEHLLSALFGLGIDNALIRIDGPEVPVLDGSALPWVELVERAGVRSLGAPLSVLRVLDRIEATDGDKWIRLDPSPTFTVDYRISFANPLIGEQRWVGVVDAGTYRSAIAPARTFGFLKDVEYLRSRGLARGGSLTNCVVVDDRRVLSGRLRFADEFVRHKVLDLVGDLSLVEYPVQGRVTVHKGGHALHAALVRSVLAHPERWQIVRSDERAATVAPLPVHDLAEAIAV